MSRGKEVSLSDSADASIQDKARGKETGPRWYRDPSWGAHAQTDSPPYPKTSIRDAKTMATPGISLQENDQRGLSGYSDPRGLPLPARWCPDCTMKEFPLASSPTQVKHPQKQLQAL